MRCLVSRAADALCAKDVRAPAVAGNLTGGFWGWVVQVALERRYLPLRGG